MKKLSWRQFRKKGIHTESSTFPSNSILFIIAFRQILYLPEDSLESRRSQISSVNSSNIATSKVQEIGNRFSNTANSSQGFGHQIGQIQGQVIHKDGRYGWVAAGPGKNESGFIVEFAR